MTSKTRVLPAFTVAGVTVFVKGALMYGVFTSLGIVAAALVAVAAVVVVVNRLPARGRSRLAAADAWSGRLVDSVLEPLWDWRA